MVPITETTLLIVCLSDAIKESLKQVPRLVPWLIGIVSHILGKGISQTVNDGTVLGFLETARINNIQYNQHMIQFKFHSSDIWSEIPLHYIALLSK